MIQFDWSETIKDWVYKSWLANQGAGVRIAMLDTGVDLAHPALNGLNRPGHKINAAVPGFDPNRLSDFNNGDVTDRHQQRGHGTQCISPLAAMPVAGSALNGFAPKAEIFIIKVNTTDHKFFLLKDFLKGLEAAAVLKVDLVIASISFPKGDLDAEGISPVEVDRVFKRLEASGAVLFAALPNTTLLKPWAGLAAAHFPSLRPGTVNVGAFSEAIFNRRREEINTQPDIHFVVSDARGLFCKIQGEHSEEAITSSYAVYLVGGIAALYIASVKRREKEDYTPRPLPELLKAVGRTFRKLDGTGAWESVKLLFFKTSAVATRPDEEPDPDDEVLT